MGLPVDLIERDGLVRSIDASLRAAALGVGATVLVEGAPGLGKTSVLAECAARGRARHMRVRTALGGELEQSLTWGVARELLGAPARDLGELLPAGAAV